MLTKEALFDLSEELAEKVLECATSVLFINHDAYVDMSDEGSLVLYLRPALHRIMDGKNKGEVVFDSTFEIDVMDVLDILDAATPDVTLRKHAAFYGSVHEDSFQGPAIVFSGAYKGAPVRIYVMAQPGEKDEIRCATNSRGEFWELELDNETNP